MNTEYLFLNLISPAPPTLVNSPACGWDGGDDEYMSSDKCSCYCSRLAGRALLLLVANTIKEGNNALCNTVECQYYSLL